MQAALKNTINYGTPFDGELATSDSVSDSTPQARIFDWQQFYFWDPDQSGALPLGNINSWGLLHHSQKAVFPNSMAEKIYSSINNSSWTETKKTLPSLSEILNQEAGYYYDTNNNDYWWQREPIQYYAVKREKLNQFGQVIQSDYAYSDLKRANPSLKIKSTLSYDDYALFVTQTTDYSSASASLNTQFTNDYQALQVSQVCDYNGNLNAVLFDPLGQVMVQSHWGSVGGKSAGDMNLAQYQRYPLLKKLKEEAKEKGKTASFSKSAIQSHFKDHSKWQAILTEPAAYLQGATQFFYYDLFAWQERGQPVGAIQLQRQISLSEENAWQKKSQDAPQSPIEIHLSYQDGLGRVIENKKQTTVGSLSTWPPASGDSSTSNSPRWICTDRRVYNSKHQVLEEYLAYYASVSKYQKQSRLLKAQLVCPPAIFHYDALERPLRHNTSKGFLTQSLYTPWEVLNYDENDSILQAPYYQAFMKEYPQATNPIQPTHQAQKNEYLALKQAELCYNTPKTSVLDNLGRVVRTIHDNIGAVPEDAFKEIAQDSGYSSQQIWLGLVNNNLLLPITKLKAPKIKKAAWINPKTFRPDTEAGYQALKKIEQSLPTDQQEIFQQAVEQLKSARLTTLNVLDIQGRALAQVDPRLLFENIAKQSDLSNFKTVYAMNGVVMTQDSADAGTSTTLTNVFGKPIFSWDSRKFLHALQYDSLQRLVKKYTYGGDGSTQNNLSEFIVYGDTVSSSSLEGDNLNGEIYQHYDGAGLVTHLLYNLTGQLLKTQRQFRPDYQVSANWTANKQTAVQKCPAYVTEYVYDDLGRLQAEKTPDGSVQTLQYNLAGQLSELKLKTASGSEESVVKNISYQASGQESQVDYGNGVSTQYRYEPTTERLLEIRSITTNTIRTTLQALNYIYDPVGNVTRSMDKTWQSVFSYNQEVKPISDYRYDPLYRLILATGRQHPALAKPGSGSNKGLRWIPACPTNPNDQKQLIQYRQHYHYDVAGNLGQIRHFTPIKNKSPAWTQNQKLANNSNQLREVTYGTSAKASKTFSYDGHGNQLTLNSTKPNLAWNESNQLSQVTIIDRPKTELSDTDYYLYDSAGQRVRKVSQRLKNQGKTLEVEDKLYLGSYEIKRVYLCPLALKGDFQKIKANLNTAELDLSKLKTDLEQDGASKILERQSLKLKQGEKLLLLYHLWTQDDLNRESTTANKSQWRYQLSDRLDSISLELNEQTQLISYEEYFPYGGTAYVAGNQAIQVAIKEYRYSGQERDHSTGLYYYGARYYAPWLGRWLSPDPAGTIDGLNLYAFVEGNPITFRDVGGMGKNRPIRRPQSSKRKGLAPSMHKVSANRPIRSKSLESFSSLMKRPNFNEGKKKAAAIEYILASQQKTSQQATKKTTKQEVKKKITQLISSVNPGRKDLAAPHRFPYSLIRDIVASASRGNGTNSNSVDTLYTHLSRASQKAEAFFETKKNAAILAKNLESQSLYDALIEKYSQSRETLKTAYDEYKLSPADKSATHLVVAFNNLASNAPGYGPHTTCNLPVSDSLHLNVEDSPDSMGKYPLTPRSKRALKAAVDIQQDYPDIWKDKRITLPVDSSKKNLVTPTGRLVPLSDIKFRKSLPNIPDYIPKKVVNIGARVVQGVLSIRN
ncbi:MAG: RHS repeat-associated core domain-containing protein [Deltaproteobacteria bacterium]|nr:RHS repeat-associated core domain-containing protein [Deltaproteobacteria bacterium]